MAKKSMIARDKKRQKLIAKFAAKRAALKEAGDLDGLQKLPRNSSPSRRKNRDMLDGRPRGFMRRFGMSRIRFREEASKGNIPGVTKSSW
ncbi:MAG: 30S ribosomal protein S14 [Candidatus Nanogingivalaceae bacterium]|jgi:ribosomal protein S14p/S29e|nr:30S ribosomal protein S14 [Candidatus Nanogingivalaceae bacterium]